MAKARGLPDSFKLNVSPIATAEPVELGDYLDDEVPKPAKAPKPAPAAPVERAPLHVVPEKEPEAIVAPAPAPAEQPQAVTQPPPPPAVERIAKAPVIPTPTPAQPARLKTTVPRKQINMTPETIAMVEQLLDYVRTYSVQKDMKGSEMFHALVLAVFEARGELDLSRVQPRGQWGTPTAAALPIALKNAFQKAIRQYSEER
jgi:hypothetical protein